MVRDLRDIFASMENNFRKYPEKNNDILDWAKGQGTTVPKRIDIWASQPPIGISIERLSEIFRLGINSKMLFIKFEDLCLYPDTTMIKIYEYLGCKNGCVSIIGLCFVASGKYFSRFGVQNAICYFIF
jgi:hypothetical protein